MRMYLPLNALRAFEAAARHLSFARAAKELCVTPTAISHQIRTLEELLDTTLFERSNGRIRLSAAAAAALAELSEGFDKLEAAMEPLNRRHGRHKISVAVSPSIASLWLLPKLQRFFDLAPGVDVCLSSVIGPDAFDDGNYDVAICSTREHPNRRVEHLMDEQFIPVCSPALLPPGMAGGRAALGQLPLIHDDKPIEHYPTWRDVFAAMQIELRDVTGGLRFNQSSLAIEAAIHGHGLLLGRRRLIEAALQRRALVPVLEPAKPVRWQYYTVCQPGPASKPVAAFVRWLQREVEAENALLRRSTTTRGESVAAC